MAKQVFQYLEEIIKLEIEYKNNSIAYQSNYLSQSFINYANSNCVKDFDN